MPVATFQYWPLNNVIFTPWSSSWLPAYVPDRPDTRDELEMVAKRVILTHVTNKTWFYILQSLHWKSYRAAVWKLSLHLCLYYIRLPSRFVQLFPRQCAYIFVFFHLKSVRPIYRTGVPLPSRFCILYIFFSTNISTEYFKHAAHSPFFFSIYRLFHNATFFFFCLIHILHTGRAKI
jgi:hypothetical protein